MEKIPVWKVAKTMPKLSPQEIEEQAEIYGLFVPSNTEEKEENAMQETV